MKHDELDYPAWNDNKELECINCGAVLFYIIDIDHHREVTTIKCQACAHVREI